MLGHHDQNRKDLETIKGSPYQYGPPTKPAAVTTAARGSTGNYVLKESALAANVSYA